MFSIIKKTQLIVSFHTFPVPKRGRLPIFHLFIKEKNVVT